MAVAKRQGRSEDQSEDFRQTEQTALLAKPNLHRAGPGGGKKHIKRGAKIGLGASLLFASFGSAHPHTSRMYFPILSK